MGVSRHLNVDHKYLQLNSNYLKEVKRLLDTGVDVNMGLRDYYDFDTPLHYAVQFDDCKELVELLISRGAEVDVKLDWLTEPPIFFASFAGAELLIKHGANVNARDSDGTTVLFYAVQRNKELVELLISKGADVNAQANDYRTPLDWAKEGEIKKILISAGAFSGELTDEDEFDIEHGREHGHPEFRIFDEIENNNIEEVKNILEEHGYLLNDANNFGETLIHFASKEGQKEIIELLISKGEDVNAVNYWGETPLYFAAESGNAEIAELLILNGANINAKTDTRASPLHIGSKMNQIEMVKLLVGKGAEVNAKNFKGETPFDLTADEAIKNLLISVGGN